MPHAVFKIYKCKDSKKYSYMQIKKEDFSALFQKGVWIPTQE